MFGVGVINFNIFFMKTLRRATLQTLGLGFFHSVTVDGKNLLKKLCLVWDRETLSVLLVL